MSKNGSIRRRQTGPRPGLLNKVYYYKIIHTGPVKFSNVREPKWKVIAETGGGVNFPGFGLPLTACTAALTSHKHERRLRTFGNSAECAK